MIEAKFFETRPPTPLVVRKYGSVSIHVGWNGGAQRSFAVFERCCRGCRGLLCRAAGVAAVAVVAVAGIVEVAVGCSSTGRRSYIAVRGMGFQKPKIGRA